jgi:hypothetical protein
LQPLFARDRNVVEWLDTGAGSWHTQPAFPQQLMENREQADVPEDDITLEDLVAFATRTASEETHQRVAQAMQNPDHPLSCLVRTKAEAAEHVRAKKRREAEQDAEDDASSPGKDGDDEPRKG